MTEVSIIAISVAKQVFQLHGATTDGEIVFSTKLSRKRFLAPRIGFTSKMRAD